MKIRRFVLSVVCSLLLTSCFSKPANNDDNYCTPDQMHYVYDENEHWMEPNEGVDRLIPYGYNGPHEFEEQVKNEGDETHDRVVNFVCKACHYTKEVVYPCIGNQFLQHTTFKLSDDGTYYIIEAIDFFDNEFDHIYFPTSYNGLPVKGIESLDKMWMRTDSIKVIIPDGYIYIGAGFLSDVSNGGYIFIPSSIEEIKEGALANYRDMIYTSFTQEDAGSILSKIGFNGTPKVVYEAGSNYQPNIKDNIQYVLDEANHTASVVNVFESSRYNGSATRAIIPNTVNFNGEYRVTRIEDGACYSKLIDSSVFNNSNLSYIGKFAFYDCVFNNGVTIPASFTTIKESAFRKASIKDLVLNEGLLRIERYAFYEADINEVTLPESIEYIGIFAFAYCPFNEITLPQTIQRLGHGAFYSVHTAYFNCLNVELFDEVTDVDESNSPFYELKQIIIGDGVTTIPAQLCYDNRHMETVIFSNSVEVIGAAAFKGTREGNPSSDSSITAKGRLVLPSSLRIIGVSAFYESPFSSTNLALPKTLEIIGEYAFYEAEFIEKFSYDDTVANFTTNVARGKNWNLYVDYWGEHYIAVQCRDGSTS